MNVTPNIRKDDNYIVNGNMSAVAGIAGPWFDCADAHLLSLHAEWTAFAGTAGTLSVEGSNDPAQVKFQTLTITVAHGSFPAVGATAAGAIVEVENPPHWVRLRYTRTAGGTTAQMQAWALARCT